MEPRDQKGLTEGEFLAAYAKKHYPSPYLTADLVVFSEEGKQILLVVRRGHPFLGMWALPGGFAKPNESLEETGVSCPASQLVPVGLFSRPGRDPRGWVVSQAYLVELPELPTPWAGDDASQAEWFRIERVSEEELVLVNRDLRLRIREECSNLAFDHSQMLFAAMKHIDHR